MWSQVEEALNQSAANVVAGIARFLPGTIALVVSLIIAALLGWLLATSVRRALNGIGFDQRMAVWGWGDAATNGGKGPTYVVSRLAGGLVIVLGLLVGLSAFSPTLTTELTLRLFGSASSNPTCSSPPTPPAAKPSWSKSKRHQRTPSQPARRSELDRPA
jgi:hypothetical protein